MYSGKRQKQIYTRTSIPSHTEKMREFIKVITEMHCILGTNYIEVTCKPVIFLSSLG